MKIPRHYLRLFFLFFLLLSLFLIVSQKETTADNNAAESYPLPLSRVRYWAYQIQDLEVSGAINKIVNSKYDMVVIEPTVTYDPDFDAKDMVNRIKASKASDGVHRKLVFAYIDIGEAEEWRWYWGNHKTYEEYGECKKSYVNAIKKWAPWVVACDPDGWAGNYPVAFWDDDWKDIVIYGTTLGSNQGLYFDSMLDEVVQDGFDGVYLDWVEAWEMDEVQDRAENEGKDPGQEMLNFIKEIRTYGKQYNPDFLVIQQNSSELINEVGANALKNGVDAIAQEGVWWDGVGGNDDWTDPEGYDYPSCCTNYYLSRLRTYKNAGFPVFVCDYALNKANEVYQKAAAEGFIAYATRRSLSKLTTTPPVFEEPNHPIIAVDKTQLNFTAVINGNTPESQTLAISTSGGGMLNWSITDDAAWLSPTPITGTGAATVTVSVNASGLAEGTYTATITISDPNASNSPLTLSVHLKVTASGIQPEIQLNRSQLNFGAIEDSQNPDSQSFTISNSGGSSLNWSISSDRNWLNCSPSSGTNSGMVNVSVDTSGLYEGTYTGTITISDPNASNSPQGVGVSLKVYEWGGDAAPFGSFDTPINGSTVRSSVPVTGWVLDDVGISSVKIYREGGTGLVYIGEPLLVEGARPDIEQAFPLYPMSYKAGWGYMLLTNFLPNSGNGTFILVAKAVDNSGHEVVLGTKTITCDNANAVKPFGAIDTPGPGTIASGSAYRNQGWVLTPMPNSIPIDGSTINVYVDGIYLGHPVYNIYRSDIATLFPGYINSDGAHAYFDIDTTTFTNGVHTIYWTASDDMGNTDGIGSRYFSIQNSVKRSGASDQYQWSVVRSRIPVDVSSPIGIIKGFNRNSDPIKSYPDDKGIINIKIHQLQLLEVRLFPVGTAGLAPMCSGYRLIGDRLTSLPIGSTLDRGRGIFYWHPGPGFLGRYQLVFIKNSPTEKMKKKHLIINIIPR